jgi:hypothetical protein
MSCQERVAAPPEQQRKWAGGSETRFTRGIEKGSRLGAPLNVLIMSKSLPGVARKQYRHNCFTFGCHDARFWHAREERFAV